MFHIGDVVRVRDDLKAYNDNNTTGVRVVPAMFEYAGTYAMITNARYKDWFPKPYWVYQLDNSQWSWTDEMLDHPVEHDAEILYKIWESD